MHIKTLIVSFKNNQKINRTANKLKQQTSIRNRNRTYLLSGRIGLVVHSEVDSSDTAALVAVSNTRPRVSDVTQCAVVVSNNAAGKCCTGKVGLNGGI
jgi:hypothetical protein